MKNLKFKRYNVGEVFDPSTAETETIHLVPVSVNPLIVKAYDVDEFGNVAEIVNDKWVEERETVMTELSKLTPATLTEEGLVKQLLNQNDSSATTVEELLTDFNNLLLKLKEAGIMDNN